MPAASVKLGLHFSRPARFSIVKRQTGHTAFCHVFPALPRAARLSPPKRPGHRCAARAASHLAQAWPSGPSPGSASHRPPESDVPRQSPSWPRRDAPGAACHRPPRTLVPLWVRVSATNRREISRAAWARRHRVRPARPERRKILHLRSGAPIGQSTRQGIQPG